MSAILGVFHFGEDPIRRGVSRAMRAQMRRRGSDDTGMWSDGSALLGASHYRWEASLQSGERSAFAQRDHLAVVADATLYYQDDLRRRLGIAKSDRHADSAHHLILSAYEQWGERCVDFLEGDYAFIVWDARARAVFLTRDFTGQRPLYYGQRGSALIAASTIGGVVAHRAVRSDLNLVAIAIDASALLYSAGSETCYSDVSIVPAGSAVKVNAVCSRTWRWWDPIVRPSRTKRIAEAADELRTVLGEAVLQRMAVSGATSIWLSGGRDSTAVFAAGQHAMATAGSRPSLRPVSLRLASDDPLNETHFIEAAAGHWQARPTWLEVHELGPMVEVEGSGERDEPHRHLYEGLMRKLAERSLTTGSRVALTGHGGDFLFEVSPVILADHLASLRLPSFFREWKALGAQARGIRTLVHWGIAPLLPARAQNLLHLIRGRPIRGYFERPVPSWLSPLFVKQHELVARARAGTPRARSGSRSEHEMWWFLTQPQFARTSAMCAEYALEQGVELRTPILDARVVHLAASRPASERRSRGQGKVLLRRAMDGLIPDVVLAPRPFKTGTLANYSAQSIASLATRMRQEFRDPMLGALGIANPNELRRVSERFGAGTVSRYVAEQLVAALQCELWLKARLGAIEELDVVIGAAPNKYPAHV